MAETKTLNAKPAAKPKEMEYGSPEEEAWLNRLDNDISNINADYVLYVQEHSDVLDNKSSQLAHMQKARHIMMFNACGAPLAHGISCDALIQAIGMYAGMSLVDKDFKKDVNQSVANLMSPYVDRKANEKGGKWSVWAVKCENARNGGRTPLDPETAALTQFAFAKKAYSDMRQPGANITEISNQYNSAVGSLYKTAAADGVSGKDINNSLKFMVGKMMEKDPSVMKYFNETSYGGVTMDDYKAETISVMDDNGKPTEQTRYTWKGNFKNRDGSDFEGTFTPRVPQNAEFHGTACSNFAKDTFSKAFETYPSEDRGKAVDCVIYQIHGIQKQSGIDIGKKVSRGEINDKTANQMRNNVENLNGFSMNEKQVSSTAMTNAVKAMVESFTNFKNTDEWSKVQDNSFAEMMKDDGMSDSEIETVQANASRQGYKGAKSEFVNGIINQAVVSVKDEAKQRAEEKAAQKASGRGHEFDNMFGQNENSSDFQYV